MVVLKGSDTPLTLKPFWGWYWPNLNATCETPGGRETSTPTPLPIHNSLPPPPA
jgi:hypothetical protein